MKSMIGVKTNVVTSCKVLGKEISDATEFPALVVDTSKRVDINQIGADKAYASQVNFTAVEKTGRWPVLPVIQKERYGRNWWVVQKGVSPALLQ